MELTLKRQQGTQVAVICDGQPSHTFDLSTLVPTDKEGLPHFLDDPGGYGRAVYQALFPPGSLARRGLGQLSATFPARLLLVPTDSLLDAIPWEYAHGPFGGDDSRDPERFLVCACHFVRGLPAEQRIPVPKRKRNLHLIAVPSDPLGHDVVPLDIESEWMRLKEIMQELPYALTLERTRPSTVERVRQLLANQQGRVLHFMGHGGQDGQGAFLCFEQDNGALKRVRAAELIGRVRGTVFLVTLNACVSAAPELTVFGNLAAALVQQKVPYALGMRSSIVDADARTFSHTFYSELARGSSVEEALFQARLSLLTDDSPRPWVIGVPVLYTALEAPSPGFAPRKGTPTIHAHPPHLDVSALPPVDGIFQGRIDELVALGTDLTGDARPSLITLHGSGGQGKTALALKAAERFAWAWPGGVWATPFENLPDRATFVTSLARFLGIETQELADPHAQKALDPHSVEQAVLTRLLDRRTLIILDNTETLVEAVRKNDATALRLVEFLKKLRVPSVSLLVTSRDLLGWSGERTYELWGLSSQEGAALFLQCVPDPHRAGTVTFAQAQQLSQTLDGHPLGLRLLGGAFNGGALAFDAFLKTYEEQLAKAKDIYVGEEHRHYQLYACVEISVRALSSEVRSLLSGLWVFHAPFLEDTAVAIFDPEAEETEHTPSPVRDCLHALWQRSLLTHRTVTVRDGKLPLYSLLPTTRPYIEQHLEPAYDRETLQARFGAAYLQIARWIYRELNRSAAAVTLAQQAREDLERAGQYVTGGEQGYYLLWRGWMVHRLGNPEGLQFLEHALEMAQGVDPDLERQALNNMALVYSDTGRPQEALKLYEQALPIRREVGDRAGEAATLNNMAGVYSDTGRPQEALKLYEQALPLMREVGDRAGEAATLNNMALVYSDTGRPQEALKLYEQALPIRREVGDRAGEAATLNNMAGVYSDTGRPQEALKLYEQALPLMREVGDRAGEAATLNNMALVYRATGRPQEALKLYEQALPLMREVGDRAGEAATLNNMALVYRATGRPQEALKLYEQALPLMREVGDRAGEATTLNNMALVYSDTGRPQEALKLYEQALPLMREVGGRAGEAATLNGLAYLYQSLQRYAEARAAFEQSVQLAEQVANPAYTVAGLVGLVLLLYQHLDCSAEAITMLEQAIMLLQATGLPQDAAGHTVEQLQQVLSAMRAGTVPGADGPSTLPTAHIQQMVSNTIAVMTEAQDHLSEWREQMTKVLHDAQHRGTDWQIEADFFTAVLDILDGRSPTLAADHPYTQAVTAIEQGIAAGGPERVSVSDEVMQAIREFVTSDDWKAARHAVEARQELLFRPEVEAIFEQNIEQAKAAGEERAIRLLELHLSILRECKQDGIAQTFERLTAAQEEEHLPFDEELIPRSIKALLGSPQEKLAHVQYLAPLAAQTTDEQLKALINTIQLALFERDLSQLGEHLEGVYRQAWESILAWVATEGVDPRLFEAIVRNTPAVFGPAAERRSEWRESLLQIRTQATGDGTTHLVALLDAVIGLLDADGNPAGLGTGLTGIYEQTWQEVLTHLPQQK